MQTTPLMVEQAVGFIATLRDTTAIHARYDRTANRIVLTLRSGVEIGFPPRLAEGLAGASADALTVIMIGHEGRSLHWPRLGMDLFVPGLLAGKFVPYASGCLGLAAAEKVIWAWADRGGKT
jgi:hypothetical protein